MRTPLRTFKEVVSDFANPARNFGASPSGSGTGSWIRDEVSTTVHGQRHTSTHILREAVFQIRPMFGL